MVPIHSHNQCDTFKMWIRILLLGFLSLVNGENEAYDCIVVGLGPSGLAALTRLTEKGYKVLGLEAMDRIGGRVNTQEFGGGMVEFGAEWIHGETGNPTFKLARDNNVAILDGDWKFHCASNAGYNQSLYEELFDYCMKAIDDPTNANNNLTLGEFVSKIFYEYVSTKPEVRENKEFCRNFLRAMELTIAGYDGYDTWNTSSVASTQTYKEHEGSQAWSWHRLGYKTLFDILLHKYNNGTPLAVDIRLNTEVQSIDWSKPDSVLVRTKGGMEFQSKKAIVTVSLGVLKHSHRDLFTPPLPEDKQKAISVLPMGVVDKICLLYDTQWWKAYTRDSDLFILTDDDRKKFAPEDWWVTDIYGYSVSMGNPNVVTLWITGAAARHMEAIDSAVVKQKAEYFLDIFYKDLPRAKEMRRTQWYSNPYTRGSYSYRDIASGSLPGAAALLATPLNGLHLAGEATHTDQYSTVHGALLTGWREADKVDQCLSKKKVADAA